MALGNRQLLAGHVHPHHLAPGSHQLGEQVGVPARAAAQIENLATLQQGRTDQAAAVVAVGDLGMDAPQQGFQPGGQGLGITAGVGLEVGAAAQLLAVIGLHGGVGGHGWAELRNVSN